MYPLIEAVLSPSPETLAGAVDEDLRDFYTQLYARPEMTDLVWLNMFRIVSSRMARHKHVVAFILYVPLDRIELINEINAMFKKVGDRHGMDNAYGFLTPIDFGKRAVLNTLLHRPDRRSDEKTERPWLSWGPCWRNSADTKVSRPCSTFFPRMRESTPVFRPVVYVIEAPLSFCFPRACSLLNPLAKGIKG
jgi:hypothetical protein